MRVTGSRFERQQNTRTNGCNRASCLLIPRAPSADTMASDGFHPGEQVYRFCGGLRAGFIVDQ